MLLVKTYLWESKIEGLGLFAGQLISKGTKIWEFEPGFDQMLHREYVEEFLSPEAQEFVNHFAFREGDIYWLDSDNARFFNSSSNPNTITIAEGYDGSKQYIPNVIAVVVAARDIEPGEEITCNYGEFDDDAEVKLSEGLS